MAVVGQLSSTVHQAMCYHVVADSQSADVIGIGTLARRYPALKQHWINVTCLLVCNAYTKRSRDVTTQILCVIGQKDYPLL